MNSQLQIYRQQQVQHEIEQASPVRLVVMLYDKAMSLLRQAVLHIDRNNVKAKGEALNRVVEIIGELQAILNRDEGGVVAQNLDAMYEFMIRSVTLANLNNDPQPLDGVLMVLEELRKGWQELEQMTQDGEVAAVTSPLNSVG
ncbi:MAG: flagellar export chaperone FliS [Nitrospirales bacterium]